MWSTTNSRVSVLAFCLIGVTAAFAKSDAWEPFEAVEPHMGALFRIKLYAHNQAEAESAFHAAFARIAELDDILSDYKEESELKRFCRAPAHQPVIVSTDLFRNLDVAQQVALASDGAFDITLGPVIRLWRDARHSGHLPERSALDAAATRCGFRKLHLDHKRHSAWLDQAGMQLDLGGIAKGYAADEALLTLSKHGITSALVAASGDLAMSNAPPGKSGWRIGVDSVDVASAPFTKILLLHNAAVSTSGGTEQHVDTGGKSYSHIIDPKTDIGLTNPITVTIVARHGLEADPLATAVSVMGVEKGMRLIERHQGTAALIVTGKGSRMVSHTSSRFQKLTDKESAPEAGKKER